MSDFHFLCKKFWLNFWLFWKLYLAINGQIWQRRRLDEKSWSGSTGSRGQGDQVPAPILPKSRRESVLPVLESRQSFSRAQVLYHKSHYPHYWLWMFYSSRPVNFGYTILVLCHVKTMMVCGEGFFFNILLLFSFYLFPRLLNCLHFAWLPSLFLFVVHIFHARTAVRQHTWACL